MFTNEELRLLMAFIKCTAELQEHAKKMLKVIFNPKTNNKDRELANYTLVDIINNH